MYLLLLALFLGPEVADVKPRCQPETTTQYFVPTVQDTWIAVHYYPWYRSGPADCSVGSRSQSRQWCECINQLKGVKPSRGFYGSDEKRIVSSQLAEMMKNGVDIVSVEWDGNTQITRNLLRTFLPALSTHNREHNDDMKFVILYDLSLRLRGSDGIQFDDSQTSKQFIRDFGRFAESSKYFRDPDYLVFRNKPVVYLYVTRGIHGSDASIQQAFEGIQKAVKAEGFSGVHLVADHLYWGKINYEKLQLMKVSAVTTFAPVDSTQGVLQKATSNYRPVRIWADKLSQLYRAGKDRLMQEELAIDIQPGIFPQYDDTEKDTAGCDPNPPRRTGKQYHLVDGSDWEYMIQKGLESRLASETVRTLPNCQEVRVRNFDGKSIIWIYSYNEWAEGSGIEQLEVKQKRYPYGFGADLLTILKNQLQ